MAGPAAGQTDALARQEDAARNARAAWLRGQAALAAGEIDGAIRWLDRAARIAPADGTIALALAAACLSRAPARAADLFAQLAITHDVREAWHGLAVARLRCGAFGEAAAALGQALGRFIAPADAGVAADAITRAAGAPGWCALSRPGELVIGGAGRGRIEVSLDGAPIALPRKGRKPGDGPHARKLPPAWRGARRLAVAADGRPLVGSPVDLAAIRRLEGCVEWDGGVLVGWAWHPADPEAEPILHLEGNEGRSNTIRARAPCQSASTASADAVLRRARGFTVSAHALRRLGTGPVRVLDGDGIDLLGSPLVREPASLTPACPVGRRRAQQLSEPRPVDVIVPVRDGGAPVIECLESLLATVGPPTNVIVVDDGSRDPMVRAALDALASRHDIRLIRHKSSGGFPRSANAGLRAARLAADVVLLNSDTVLPRQWLDRLREAAYGAADIGSACPISNSATILSYPMGGMSHPMPDRPETERLAALAHRANRGCVVEIPTPVGFCMFVRRDCLRAVGLLREDAFAQGYGEENDWAMRARALGWRHVAAPGVFVAHRGGLSFASASAHLARRNARVLASLHPHYDGLVADFVAKNPLADARRRLDAARWRRSPNRPGVVLVSHDQGGGVERHLAERCAALAAEGHRPIVVRPGHNRTACVDDGLSRGFPNLRFALPAELGALARFLARQRPVRMEFHHLLDHHPGLMALPARLGVPYSVAVHDYAWFCPRVTLLGGARRYCGEPAVAECERCVAEHGSALEEDISVAALRARAAKFLAAASRVHAPSTDAALRMRRQFPGLAVQTVANEPDPPPARRRRSPGSGRARICVIGGIGAAKGYDVLLAAALDAATRALPLEFAVVGLTDDDERLIATGRVFVTGPYKPDEAVALIEAQQADVALLPSVVPETWCFSLSEAWQAGLDVLAFDLGAPAERIRRAGRGRLLLPSIPVETLNDTLLAMARETGQEWPRRSATKNCHLVAR